LFIVTRDLDVTDVLFRLTGMLAGLVLRLGSEMRLGSEPPGPARTRSRRFVTVAAAATAAYILYNGIIPLCFAEPVPNLWRQRAADVVIPFYAYFFTRFDLFQIDVIEKFLSYAVLAALLAVWLAVRGGVVVAAVRARAVTLGVMLSVAIECVQLLEPVRVPSLTDPLLAWGGGLAGVAIVQRMGNFYREALASGVSPVPGTPDEPLVRPSLAPLDALIASLTEPSPSAPVEPEGRPHPVARGP
jgi:hypothetical protein